MSEPQEIEDEEYEQVLERVAAIDVARATGMVCTRVPHPSRPGGRQAKAWNAGATTNAILELGEYLAGPGIEKVTLESASDYWRPFYYLLEAAGLDVQLVNARDVKNVPGRPESDKPDCVWQAKLTRRGMLRPSFVPRAGIRQLRDYTRLRLDLTRDRSRHAPAEVAIFGSALQRRRRQPLPGAARTLPNLPPGREPPGRAAARADPVACAAVSSRSLSG